MYVDHEAGIVFLAQPRTGSRAIKDWISNRNGVDLIGPHHSVDPAFLKVLQSEGYRSFSVVRNHWDIVVSFYYLNRLHGNREEFHAWITRFVHRDGWVDHGGEKGSFRIFWKLRPYSDELLRYEHGLAERRSKLYGEPVVLPSIGISDRKPYRDYYTEALRQYVADWFADEIATLGYEF
jgi:hypothetical protein